LLHSLDQRIPKLSASERGVYAASLPLLAELALNSNLVGSFTLKRPERPRSHEPTTHGCTEPWRHGWFKKGVGTACPQLLSVWQRHDHAL